MNRYSINNKLSDNNDTPLMSSSSSSDSAELQYKKLLQILLVSYIAPNTTSPSGKISMMPLAPTMTELPAAHNVKIEFSIDSIVGGGGGGGRKEEDGNNTISKSHHHQNHHERSRRTSSSLENNTSGSRSPTQTPPEERCSPDTPENRGLGMSPLLAHFPKHHPHHQLLHHHLLNTTEEKNGSLSPPMQPSVHPRHPHHHLLHPLHHQLRLPLLHHQQQPPQHPTRSPLQSPERLSASSTNNNKPSNNDDNNTSNSINSNSKDQDQVTSVRIPSPQSRDSPKHNVPSQSPEIHPPIQQHPGALGIPRPGFPHPHPPGMPPQFATYPPGMLNFAVAAAAAAQQGHHPGLPGWMPGHPGGPHHPHPAAAAHPLYPWLLAKQSRLFPHRFGPGPADLPGFLFQPFRKPKRIRTAFSPSQLLKLEHPFEKNHYVVGAERKQLAKSLSLSETQVKVWFQNRRTKHKRVEQEEDTMKKPDGSGRGHNKSSSSDLPSSGSNHSNSAISADSSTRNYSEEMSDDEEIVMDDDYSDEEEMDHNHGHHSMHHLSNSYS